jgi:hypothetical protein
MALRNQPYFPLYVNDFLSDEKLILCSAESTGVYIRIMCLMHKSDEYGVILLKQKFKQNTKQSSNFASQLAIFLPYTSDVIERSIDDLVENNVLHIDGDRMIQTRMVKDEKISQARAFSGSKGGKKSVESRSFNSTPSVKIASSFAQPNIQANAEYVNEDKDDSILDSSNMELRESNEGTNVVIPILTKTEKELRDEQKKNRKKKADSVSEEKKDEIRDFIPFVDEYEFSGDLRDAVINWLEYKNDRKEYYTDRGIRTMLKQAKRKAKEFGEDAIISAFETAVERKWMGTLIGKMTAQSVQSDSKMAGAVPKFQNKSGRFEQIDFDKIEV